MPTKMFGGSPISVAVPPTFENTISPKIYGRGLISISSAASMVRGIMRRIVVTLSMNIDTTAVRRERYMNIIHNFPFDNFNVFTPKYPKNPVLASSPTKVIIPKRRIITSQSTYPSMDSKSIKLRM